MFHLLNDTSRKSFTPVDVVLFPFAGSNVIDKLLSRVLVQMGLNQIKTRTKLYSYGISKHQKIIGDPIKLEHRFFNLFIICNMKKYIIEN